MDAAATVSRPATPSPLSLVALLVAALPDALLALWLKLFGDGVLLGPGCVVGKPPVLGARSRAAARPRPPPLTTYSSRDRTGSSSRRIESGGRLMLMAPAENDAVVEYPSLVRADRGAEDL